MTTTLHYDRLVVVSSLSSSLLNVGVEVMASLPLVIYIQNSLLKDINISPFFLVNDTFHHNREKTKKIISSPFYDVTNQ